MASRTTSMPSEPPILRRGSSHRSQPSPQASRSTSFPDLPRRQSTQERLDEILQNAQTRADSMGPVSEQEPPYNALPQAARQDESIEPDETTGIMMAGNRRNYQSTLTSSTPRNRKHPGQSNGAPDAHPDAGADQDETESVDEKGSLMEWFNSFWSIELENKGSVARDHLALERTFLAWLRTSLAFASIGIAVTQLFRLNTSLTDGNQDSHIDTIRHLGKPLGATFLGVSVLVLFLGFQRYQQSQQWVMKGKYPASRGSVILLSLIAFTLMAISLIIVVVIGPGVAVH